MNRTPPKKILDILRSEVNFGCPICGNPYLTWHHFDPPWYKKNHHNPEGMIALCQEHHSKADAGAFTNEQLLEFKKNPVSKIVKGEFNWLRNKLVLRLGSNWYYNSNTILTIENKKIIWFNRDIKNNLLLNFILPTTTGEWQYIIKDNWWFKVGKPKTLVCPPSGKKIEIRYSNKNYIKIDFTEYLNPNGLLKKYSNAPNELLNKENEVITQLKKNPRMRNLDWPELKEVKYPLTVINIDVNIKKTPIVFTSNIDSVGITNSLFWNVQSAIKIGKENE